MPSWQARCFNAATKALVRRRKWGKDGQAVAGRSRRLFGSGRLYQWLRSRGVKITKVDAGQVKGEWVEPPQARPAVILYIHGGGFVSCSPATHRPITAALARMSGRRVFSVDYRLAPEHKFPAAIEDILTAYRWLYTNVTDPDSISIAGDSAGGGLTLTVIQRLRDEKSPLPGSAVCFSPWADLAGTGESIRINNGKCAMFRPENIPEFAEVYLGSVSPTDPAASPIFGDFSGLPPVLLQVGSSELLLDDARVVHEKILAAGGTSKLEIYEDVFHCWQMLDGIVPESRIAIKNAVDFIADPHC
jgi:epsilon-lactone hydrolase